MDRCLIFLYLSNTNILLHPDTEMVSTVLSIDGSVPKWEQASVLLTDRNVNCDSFFYAPSFHCPYLSITVFVSISIFLCHLMLPLFHRMPRNERLSMLRLLLAMQRSQNCSSCLVRKPISLIYEACWCETTFAPACSPVTTVAAGAGY